jgi:hypothetical protein
MERGKAKRIPRLRCARMLGGKTRNALRFSVLGFFATPVLGACFVSVMAGLHAA